MSEVGCARVRSKVSVGCCCSQDTADLLFPIDCYCYSGLGLVVLTFADRETVRKEEKETSVWDENARRKKKGM